MALVSEKAIFQRCLRQDFEILTLICIGSSMDEQ